MDYIDPKVEKLSVTYNDITYEQTYYKPAIKITGVVDESYPDWAAGTTYAANDYVVIPELKRIFKSAANSNTGNFPLVAGNTNWVDYGSINSYKMFSTDQDIGSQTTGTDGILEFNFNQSTSIAGLDLDFATADVTLIYTDGVNWKSDYDAGTTYATNDLVIFTDGSLYKSLVDSNIGNTPDTSPTQWENADSLKYFNEEVNGTDYGALTYGEYFYIDAKIKTRKILTDLEWLPSSILRIEFTGAFKIGTICYNVVESLGATLVGSRLRYQSDSKIATSEVTGFRTILRYGTVRLLDVDVIYDTNLFGNTSQKVDNLIDKNVIWIPTENDVFSEAISIGYIEDYELPMEVHNKTKSTARIVGISKQRN